MSDGKIFNHSWPFHWSQDMIFERAFQIANMGTFFLKLSTDMFGNFTGYITMIHNGAVAKNFSYQLEVAGAADNNCWSYKGEVSISDSSQTTYCSIIFVFYFCILLKYSDCLGRFIFSTVLWKKKKGIAWHCQWEVEMTNRSDFNVYFQVCSCRTPSAVFREKSLRISRQEITQKLDHEKVLTCTLLLGKSPTAEPSRAARQTSVTRNKKAKNAPPSRNRSQTDQRCPLTDEDIAREFENRFRAFKPVFHQK